MVVVFIFSAFNSPRVCAVSVVEVWDSVAQGPATCSLLVPPHPLSSECFCLFKPFHPRMLLAPFLNAPS